MVTVDSKADAFYSSISSDSYTFDALYNTFYPLNAGVYDVGYAECYYEIGSSETNYYINKLHLDTTSVIHRWESRPLNDRIDPDNSLGLWVASATEPLFHTTLTVEANSGSSSEGKTAGMDKYYTLHLGWDPADTTVSTFNFNLQKTILEDTEKKSVVQFKDEYRTFTLTAAE